MSKFSGFLVGALLLAGIGFIFWHHYGPKAMETPAAVAATEEAPIHAVEDALPTPAEAPEASVPEPPGDTAMAELPRLADSDAAMRRELEALSGREPFEALLIPRDIIRRWVVFIDRLDRDGVPLSQRPLRHVAGTPPVNKTGERLLLDDSNALRYAAYVQALQKVWLFSWDGRTIGSATDGAGRG